MMDRTQHVDLDNTGEGIKFSSRFSFLRSHDVKSGRGLVIRSFLSATKTSYKTLFNLTNKGDRQRQK